MRETGAIIGGDLARAFFTGDDHKDLPVTLELLFSSSPNIIIIIYSRGHPS
jgi:hypothetical protein